MFRHKRLDQITIEDVDGFRSRKVREGQLSATSAVAPRGGSWLDRADHLAALLDAAGKLDEAARTHRGQRRALLATLIFAGLRIGEALSLRWGDIDLARRTITVRKSKTEAGVRVVDILPLLHDELTAYRVRIDPDRQGLVFGTSKGTREGATNVRKRILDKDGRESQRAAAQAQARAAPRGPDPHIMRRTFASILFALDEKPTYVMAQMGHTTANLTLTIYAREMDRRDGEPERLRRLVEGGDLSEYVRGKDGGRQDSAIETGPHNAAEPVNSGKKGA